MQEREFSNYRLAQISGISEATIGRWLHEDTSPSVSNVTLVANALNTTVQYLLGETEKKEKPVFLDELPENDRILIEAIRNAAPEKKKAILDLLK